MSNLSTPFNVAPFHHNVFTSTLHKYHSALNIYLVIMTAILFFLVLSFYNFLLALYAIFIHPNTGTNLSCLVQYLNEHNYSRNKEENTCKQKCKKNICKKKGNNPYRENYSQIALASFGYFIIWAIIAFLAYYILNSYHLLGDSSDSLQQYGEHPILRNEARDIARDIGK